MCDISEVGISSNRGELGEQYKPIVVYITFDLNGLQLSIIQTRRGLCLSCSTWCCNQVLAFTLSELVVGLTYFLFNDRFNFS